MNYIRILMIIGFILIGCQSRELVTEAIPSPAPSVDVLMLKTLDLQEDLKKDLQKVKKQKNILDEKYAVYKKPEDLTPLVKKNFATDVEVIKNGLIRLRNKSLKVSKNFEMIAIEMEKDAKNTEMKAMESCNKQRWFRLAKSKRNLAQAYLNHYYDLFFGTE